MSTIIAHKANTRLPTGYAGSADIFKAEMMKLMEALDMYEHTLTTSWSSLEEHCKTT